jgi:hypothetical protein
MLAALVGIAVGLSLEARSANRRVDPLMDQAADPSTN